MKFRVLRAQGFYTPLGLSCEKGQHLSALEVYKNQSPIFAYGGKMAWSFLLLTVPLSGNWVWFGLLTWGSSCPEIGFDLFC